MKSDPQLRQWYKVFNRKWFNNRLPLDTKLYYAEELVGAENARSTTFGEAEWEHETGQAQIRINPQLRELGMKSVVLATLLHEMAHLEEFRRRIKGDHGPGWEAIMLRLAKRGAFSKRNGVVKHSIW